MATKSFRHNLLVKAVLLLAADALFFGLINPDKVNFLGLLVGLVLLSATFYLCLWVIFGYLGHIGVKIGNRKRLTGFIVAVVGLLIALQSIGQLSVPDVLAILPLAVILYLYLYYSKPRNTL